VDGLAIQFNATVCEVGAGLTPVPLSAMMSDGVASPGLTCTLPLAAPLLDGSNATEKVTFCPGARVIGAAKPVTRKPGPLVLAEETAMLDAPGLLNCTFCVVVVFSGTLPNAMLAGFAASCPDVPLVADEEDGTPLQPALNNDRTPRTTTILNSQRVYFCIWHLGGFTAPVRRGDLISGALHLEWRVKTGICALKLHSASGLVGPSPVVNSALNYCKLEEKITYAISPRKREFLTLRTESSPQLIGGGR
jgi:hypothetical protein